MKQTTKKVKLEVIDQRMLDVMEWAIANNKQNITTEKEFCKLTKTMQSSISQIRNGTRSFTREQLSRAGEIFKVDMNFLFGFSDSMIRIDVNENPILAMKQALIATEKYYKLTKKEPVK